MSLHQLYNNGRNPVERRATALRSYYRTMQTRKGREYLAFYKFSRPKS